MRRLSVLLFVLMLSTTGCAGSAPVDPAELTAEEKEKIKQQLNEVQKSEAAER